ncbi:MAG TPA: dTMP kinase [Acidimicrobiia bacterium]|nr:dTMP kinase [Acidimicrobiia bacterium]
MTPGHFVVLEGGDASGKSTQARRLAWRLGAAGRTVIETFEPGDTELGRAIREQLLDGPERIDPVAEALLLAADRAQQVAEVIRPALEHGDDVVGDRYVPSSLAYQGVGRGLGVEVVEQINQVATGGLEPVVVVVLDVTDAVAAARRRGAGDRLERAGVEFHAAVRQAYRDLAAERGWTVVDGTGTEDQVHDLVWKAVAGVLDVES